MDLREKTPQYFSDKRSLDVICKFSAILWQFLSCKKVKMCLNLNNNHLNEFLESKLYGKIGYFVSVGCFLQKLCLFLLFTSLGLESRFGLKMNPLGKLFCLVPGRILKYTLQGLRKNRWRKKIHPMRVDPPFHLD